MEQYIPKSAVVAKIEARYNECLKRAKIIDSEYWNGKADAYRDMLVVLNTIEVKEVDLDEEIEKCLKLHSMLAVGKKDFTDIAKHFFELGMSVRNKEQKGE